MTTTIEMDIEITEDIKNCKEFFTDRTISQFIYKIMESIDELEEIANPTNFQVDELDEQYNQLDKFVSIRKKLFNK